MNIKPHLIFIGIMCLLLASVSAQDEEKNCPKLIAQNKNVRGIVKLEDENGIEISSIGNDFATGTNEMNCHSLQLVEKRV